ncbi:hypothetical protein CL617_02315 [archaeon]|nr:hypothetical protein [archaeon]|tara:strand:- start:9202 stop:9789 length:588 start_codon:yes stop_codon:yes gene_type:complete
MAKKIEKVPVSEDYKLQVRSYMKKNKLSWKLFSEDLGESGETIRRYFSANSTEMPLEKKNKIDDYLGQRYNEQEEFRDEGFETKTLSSRLTQPNEDILKGLNDLEKNLKAEIKNLRETISPEETYSEKLNRISDLFYGLIESLDDLKKASLKDRQQLGKVIDKRDAGYLITLFNTYFKEDPLNEWMLDVDYKTKR